MKMLRRLVLRSVLLSIYRTLTSVENSQLVSLEFYKGNILITKANYKTKTLIHVEIKF